MCLLSDITLVCQSSLFYCILLFELPYEMKSFQERLKCKLG